MTEQGRVEEIGSSTGYLKGVLVDTTDYGYQIFKRHLPGKTVVELGPAEGVMTERLIKDGFDVTAVEGSSALCANLRDNIPGAQVVHSLFESYEPESSFDAVILGHVLEHVIDPLALLRQARNWVAPGHGRILAAVPNANSIHRQAAVLMGLLPHASSLNPSDVANGHRRVFTPDEFRALFRGAGLSEVEFGGYWLKPFSNDQIQSWYSPQMIDAFLRLGETYPEIAGEMYLIACVQS